MKGFHVNGGSINDDMGIKSSQKLHLMSNKNDDVGAPWGRKNELSGCFGEGLTESCHKFALASLIISDPMKLEWPGAYLVNQSRHRVSICDLSTTFSCSRRCMCKALHKRSKVSH